MTFWRCEGKLSPGKAFYHDNDLIHFSAFGKLVPRAPNEKKSGKVSRAVFREMLHAFTLDQISMPFKSSFF
jgi:hypothetical protein